jgi:pyruvate formate lyase activating enzyme
MRGIKEIGLDDSFLVTNIQRFSVNDGPGIRTTVFLKGCPLQCAWCHNPECINPYQEFFFAADKCRRCGSCFKVCPRGAIIPPKVIRGVDNDPNKEIIQAARINRDKCNRCMRCIEECRYGALYLSSRLMTVSDVIAEAKKDSIFYSKSGGGITISGGEPLSQPGVTLSLLRRAKEEGLHTVLDTSGFTSWEVIVQVMPYVDMFLFDLKTLDDVKHKRWTGVSNKLILENIRKLAKLPTNIRLRTITIHNLNYWDLLHPKRIALFARSLGHSITGIDIIPFHNFAESKYERLGLKYKFKGFPNLYPEDVADYKEVMMANCSWEPTIGGLMGRGRDNAASPDARVAELAF